jgi:hypothetical protein
MFRRYLCAFILVQGLALAGPASSLAIDWYWIDSLSGPKLDGPVFEWRVACFKSKSRPEPKEVTAAGSTDRRQFEKFGGVAFGGSIGPSCTYQKGQRRRGSIQVAFGLLSADREARFADNEPIKATTLEPSFLWQIHDRVPLELGFGAGVYWFSSPGFDSFERVTLQPLRIDFRPFDWSDEFDNDGFVTSTSRGSWWAAAFIVRLGVVVFPQGFAATDFRDLRGRDEAREIKKYFSVAIDSEPIIRRWVTKTWLPPTK